MENNFEDYLKPTKYCDFENIKIIELAKSIINNSNDTRRNAIACFYWVRDNIKYYVGNWNYKASQTIDLGYGTCTNKANLLIALLRSINIPAGYGYMRVKGQEYFGEIIIPIFKKKVAKNSVHIFCYIFLDNYWIKCDPSDDKLLCDKTSYFNSTTQIVEWDGYHDAMINLNQNHIIYNHNSPIDNLDHLIDKKPRNGKGVPVKVANIYLDFLRHSKQKFNSISDVQIFFLKYLLFNYTLYFLIFFSIFWYKDIKNQ